MDIHKIDTTLSWLQKDMATQAGAYLSIYGSDGTAIFTPVNENSFLSHIRSTPMGKGTYEAFIRKNIAESIKRNDVSIVMGPAKEYHFFVPIPSNNSAFVLAGGGTYLSFQDFETFFRDEGYLYGLNLAHLKEWSIEIGFADRENLLKKANHLNSIFHLCIGTSMRQAFTEKKHCMMKMILGLLSGDDLHVREEEIYVLFLDIMLFLLNVEGVSVAMHHKGSFTIKSTDGMTADRLRYLAQKHSGTISEVLEKGHPVHSESVTKIMRSGFGEEITSLQAFPLPRNEWILLLLNSNICSEDEALINELCRMAGFLLRLAALQNSQMKCLQNIDVLHAATARVMSVKDMEMLCDTILDTSMRLVSAERGSCMLVDRDTPDLTIKASRGIHKRILDELRIRAGEGIAGRVFSEGEPLLVLDIKKYNKVFAKKRPEYTTDSFISVPLILGQETIGVLNVSDKITRESFSIEDLCLLRSFASCASIALERSNYYEFARNMKDLSIIDPLTELFNKRYFEEKFCKEIERAKRHDLSFSLAMIDIDDFKLFNDTEGHLAGDEVLKCIAHHMRECLRMMDVVARFGGEEFVAVMPQTTKEEALLVSERIRTTVKQEIPRIWRNYPKEQLTVSIGIAAFPDDGEDGKELLENADRALYRAKLEGKDRTVLWEA